MNAPETRISVKRYFYVNNKDRTEQSFDVEFQPPITTGEAQTVLESLQSGIDRGTIMGAEGMTYCGSVIATDDVPPLVDKLRFIAPLDAPEVHMGQALIIHNIAAVALSGVQNI